MNKTCAQHATESKQQLKTGGLKVTSARLELLDIFKHAKKPLSIKQIAQKLKNSSVDLVTLYRNVESLETLGHIKEIRLRDKQAYYELNDGSHHHHLICTDCGKLEDIKVREMNLDKNFLKRHGFAKVTDHALEFFGVCKSCTAR